VPAARVEDRRFKLFAVPEYRIGDVTETVVGGAQLEREGIEGQRDVKHLIAATGLAVDDAGLRSGSGPVVDLREVGLVVADEHPGVERLARVLYAAVAGGSEPPPRDYDEVARQIFALNTFLVPYTVARAHGIGGECAFVNSACASGLTAIDNAATQVRAGRTPVAVAAAADDPFSAGKYRWFADQHLYAADGMVRPFDGSSGTVFGDGGAALVLEDESHAVGRGARIYGRYLGGGFTQDGWRVNAPNPKLANQARSIRRALREAGRDAVDVDVLVPHGTGISVIDKYELRTMRDLWPDPAVQPVCVPLKPYVGHNLGGSSLVESALLLKAMRERCLPGSWEPRAIQLAVKTTAAFGGFYGSVVLEAT
jgi:3-oxoacyl-[acyl-carrier-protein] synthase II